MRLTAPPVLLDDIWGFLLTDATTVGSLGKLIADNLDATVSTRSTPGSTLTGLNRMFENYTPVFGIIADNDTTLVTVLNISGRGILASIGKAQAEDIDNSIDVVITIDGGGAITTNNLFGNRSNAPADGGAESDMVVMAGFSSSLLVQMRLGLVAVDRVWFRAVALVE